MFLNNQTINNNPEFHYLKAGILLVTSTTQEQSVLMDEAGYFFDGAQFFNTWMSNSYEQRRDIFRAADGSFDGLPKTFIGPLYHDLMSCGTGIPPVKLTLFYNRV